MRSARGFACLRPSLRFDDAGWSPARLSSEARPTALPDPARVATGAGARLDADMESSAPAIATLAPAAPEVL
jgi:hypothetical protein